jgi:protein-S-isoprenylcysteine O-methyltransferase Ste14
MECFHHPRALSRRKQWIECLAEPTVSGASFAMRLPLFLRIALFTLVVPGTVACWLPLFILPAISRSTVPRGPWMFVGIPLILAGIAGYVWCAWDFARAQGTPAPIDPPQSFVAHGLYRHVRNPMYVSVLAAIVGEALLLRSGMMIIYAGVVWVGFHLFVTRVEEPGLRRKFAGLYGEYCRRTGRWLPRVRSVKRSKTR